MHNLDYLRNPNRFSRPLSSVAGAANPRPGVRHSVGAVPSLDITGPCVPAEPKLFRGAGKASRHNILLRQVRNAHNS